MNTDVNFIYDSDDYDTLFAVLIPLKKKLNITFERIVKFNQTRTSKAGAISKAHKAQNIFLGKKLEILETFF